MELDLTPGKKKFSIKLDDGAATEVVVESVQYDMAWNLGNPNRIYVGLTLLPWKIAKEHPQIKPFLEIEDE